MNIEKIRWKLHELSIRIPENICWSKYYTRVFREGFTGSTLALFPDFFKNMFYFYSRQDRFQKSSKGETILVYEQNKCILLFNF